VGREREAGAKGRYLGIRLGAVFALALGVAFVLWLVLRNHDGSTAARTTTTTQSTVVGPKRTIVQGLTAPTLKSRAAISDRPIYWIGAQAGTKYEFTQTPDGKIFIRYLPRSVAVGDRKGRYTIVGGHPGATPPRGALSILTALPLGKFLRFTAGDGREDAGDAATGGARQVDIPSCNHGYLCADGLDGLDEVL